MLRRLRAALGNRYQRWIAGAATGEPEGIASLAVLPFENRTKSHEHDHVIAGMHDALIGELARLRSLRVISRRSVMHFVQTDKSVSEIGSMLNVDGVLVVAFDCRGDAVHLRVELIRVRPDERSLSVREYECQMADAWGMHRMVAADIARALDLRHSAEGRARLGVQPAIGRETYETYLRGRFAIMQGTLEAIDRGLECLRELAERYPTDPLAYVGLAMGYGGLGQGPEPHLLPLAVVAAEHALELDSTLAEPYAVLAEAKLYREWDWAGAEQAFHRALDLNPSLADTRAHFAWYLDLIGPREQALVEMRRTIEGDPLEPLWPAWLSYLYTSRGLLDQAIAEARGSLELHPDFVPGLFVLGRALASKGVFEDAIATHQRAAALSPEWRWTLAHSYARAGRLDEARRIATELEADPSPLDLWGLPHVYAAIGDNDRAFVWLERAFDVPHPYAPWTAPPQNPDLASLCGDPRFEPLMERLKLPSRSLTR